MFWRTVSHGNTPYSWKITPRSGPGSATGRPSSSTRPFVGLTKPPTMFIKVVLPQPDGPMIETNSPFETSNETSSITRIGPAAVSNSTETLSKWMRIGSAHFGFRYGSSGSGGLIGAPSTCGPTRRAGPSSLFGAGVQKRSCEAVLPGDEAARRGAQREVHRQRDQTDAD